MIDRLAAFAILAAIPVTWGALEVAAGNEGGWVLVVFGVAVGWYGATR